MSRTYTNERPINVTGVDKIHLKSDLINGGIASGLREIILFSVSLYQPPVRKIYKKPRIKLFKKMNKSFPSHIPFYIEDNNYKTVSFIGEAMISFTCQLIKG